VNCQNKKALISTHRMSFWLMAVQCFCNVATELLSITWIWWIEGYLLQGLFYATPCISFQHIFVYCSDRL